MTDELNTVREELIGQALVRDEETKAATVRELALRELIAACWKHRAEAPLAQLQEALDRLAETAAAKTDDGALEAVREEIERVRGFIPSPLED